MASMRTETHLTNGQVYNWLKELPSRKWKDICDGFQEKLSSFECECKPLYNSVITVEKRVKLLKQNKSKINQSNYISRKNLIYQLNNPI